MDLKELGEFALMMAGVLILAGIGLVMIWAALSGVLLFWELILEVILHLIDGILKLIRARDYE